MVLCGRRKNNSGKKLDNCRKNNSGKKCDISRKNNSGKKCDNSRKNRSGKKRHNSKKQYNKCNKIGGCEKNKSKKCKRKAYVFIDSCSEKSIYEKYSDNINKKLPMLLVAKTLDETSLLHDNYLHNDVFLTIMYYLKNPDYELLECAENGFN